MPLYEYICQECEHPFETLVFGGEEAECPQCHSRKLQRQLSLPATEEHGVSADRVPIQRPALWSRLLALAGQLRD